MLDTFSVQDNIFLPLVLAGKSFKEMKQRLDPIAHKLMIYDLLNKYPYEISGGQKQRAAVARALITAVSYTHLNSATSSSAKGYENFYFYPFSMPLARNVFDSVGSTGHLTMRSVKYYPYYVTRVTECPSILTENGFEMCIRDRYMN